MSGMIGVGGTSLIRCFSGSTYRGDSLEEKLSGLEFFKDSFFSDADKQPVIDSLTEANEMESDRMFVQLGLKDARSTVGLIMALNEMKNPSRLVAIDSHASSKFAWNSLCSGIMGHCEAQFYSSVVDYVAINFSYYGPSWVLMSGCPCHRCVKAYLKDWLHRIVLGGFLVAHQANELYEGTKVPSPYHLDSKTEVRCGVLRAIESTSRIKDGFFAWRHNDTTNTKIWRRER